MSGLQVPSTVLLLMPVKFYKSHLIIKTGAHDGLLSNLFFPLLFSAKAAACEILKMMKIVILLTFFADIGGELLICMILSYSLVVGIWGNKNPSTP